MGSTLVIYLKTKFSQHSFHQSKVKEGRFNIALKINYLPKIIPMTFGSNSLLSTSVMQVLVLFFFI